MCVLQSPGVLQGLGSSGRLVGFTPTYPGTSPTSWCRGVAKELLFNRPSRDSCILTHIFFIEHELLNKHTSKHIPTCPEAFTLF